MSCTYTKAGRILVSPGDVRASYQRWEPVSRCGSCGSLVKSGDEKLHDDFHARLNELAEMVTRPLVEAGRITINAERRLMGMPEFGHAPT
jgi:hypothetical protein